VNDENKTTPKGGDSRISRAFITSTAVIFALLIITAAISFNYYMRKHSELLHDIIIDINSGMLLEKIDVVMDRLRQDETEVVADIKKMLADYCTEERGFLCVIIYTKTSDDNYFKVADIVKSSRNIVLDLDKKSQVKELKEENYLKMALHRSIVEPKFYSQNGISWENVYSPFKTDDRTLVLQFLMSADRATSALDMFANSCRESRIVFSAVSGVLAVAVAIISLLFSHNFTLLIKNLSAYMNKAASGDLQVNLKTTDDQSLNELAQSFNSLIDELKDKSDRPSADPYGDMFREGVSRLKDEKIHEAMAIFTTLSIMRPEGFGSFFNLGVAQAKLKNYPLSLKMFTRARELNPGHELTDRYIDKVERLIAAGNAT
jgi:hypothetical protein